MKKNIIEIAMETALTPQILGGIEDKMGLYAAIRSAMSTSVGGIGPLLRERIIAQADLGINVIGVTLLYNQVWIQRWHSWGQFYLEKGNSAEYIRPLIRKWDTGLRVNMPDGVEQAVTVWEAVYGKGKVYFLDAPRITNIVYPGPEDAPVEVDNAQEWAKQSRIRQSWLLGRGGLELLKALKMKPDCIVLSETPTIFGCHRLVADGLDKEGLFREAKYIFNDHTPLEYAHPVWSEEQMKLLKIKPECYKNLESYKRNPDKIDITQLIVNSADAVYGVSRKHGEVMRKMHSLVPYADKIKTITNGVSCDIWQADALKKYDKLSDNDLLAVKQSEKEKLIDWMWLRYKFSSGWRQSKKTSPLVIWMRRVTSYKRLDILKEIINNDAWRKRFVDLGITIFLGGRIHQNDAHSDWLVFELLDIIQKYPELEGLLILLDNFNVWEAPRMFRGMDAAIMISNAGREASATGFMKAQLNGAMVIATCDGAIAESVYFYRNNPKGVIPNGFRVEYEDDCPTPETLLKALEQFKQVYDNIPLRIQMIRSALARKDKVDVMRTAREMENLYKQL